MNLFDLFLWNVLDSVFAVYISLCVEYFCVFKSVSCMLTFDPQLHFRQETVNQGDLSSLHSPLLLSFSRSPCAALLLFKFSFLQQYGGETKTKPQQKGKCGETCLKTRRQESSCNSSWNGTRERRGGKWKICQHPTRKRHMWLTFTGGVCVCVSVALAFVHHLFGCQAVMWAFDFVTVALESSVRWWFCTFFSSSWCYFLLKPQQS